ncbi:sensor histidine kinase [Tsukamurella sp. 1534]|uniref:sensor histidine kinase n=1 Tax=Tsukamurella sp. 1534 TaxID=1151061 RepID=UPI0006ACF87C|nr:histidine kinase [Tsukamurella sp. 1534]
MGLGSGEAAQWADASMLDPRPHGRSGEPETTSPSKVVDWFRRHSAAVDVVVATSIFLYDLMYTTSLYLGDVGVARLGAAAYAALVASSAAICVLYVFRRRSPLVSSIAVYLASWLYMLLASGFGVAPMIVLALMLYFLSTRRGGPVVVAAVVAVAVWMVAASIPLIDVGYIRIGEVGVLVLADVLAAIIGALTRVRRRYIAGLQEVAWRLARERDAHAKVAAAEERARIAREIHDIVAHGLGTMVVAADGATVTVDAEPERAKAMIAQVRDTGRAAMSDMRRMLDVLRDDAEPAMAPQPGLAHLDQLIVPLRASGTRVDVSVAGQPRELPPGVDLAAHRIVQEALTNARKHGGPMMSVIEVSVAYADDVVEVRVVDDGDGPRSDLAWTDTGGHGLVGMRERVNAYDGEVRFRRRARGGFEVHAVLPTGGER